MQYDTKSDDDGSSILAACASPRVAYAEYVRAVRTARRKRTTGSMDTTKRAPPSSLQPPTAGMQLETSVNVVAVTVEVSTRRRMAASIGCQLCMMNVIFFYKRLRGPQMPILLPQCTATIRSIASTAGRLEPTVLLLCQLCTVQTQTTR